MFHVISLTSDEIGAGKLDRIMSAITGASDLSTKRVKDGYKPSRQTEVLVRFDNSSTDSQFHQKWGKVQDILYLNDGAYGAVLGDGIQIVVLNEVDSVPEHAGTALKLPLFI